MMAPGPTAPQGPQAAAPGDPAAPVDPNTAASTPDETADNVDAKLSGGEFVVPAFAVKYFGIDKFHKMVKSAEQGIAEMHQSGMIKGGDPEAPKSDPQAGPAPVHAADGAYVQGQPGGAGVMSPNCNNGPINMASGGFLMRPGGRKPHLTAGSIPGPSTTTAMKGQSTGLSQVWKDFAQKFGTTQ